jgi:hypothetical protein
MYELVRYFITQRFAPGKNHPAWDAPDEVRRQNVGQSLGKNRPAWVAFNEVWRQDAGQPLGKNRPARVVR